MESLVLAYGTAYNGAVLQVVIETNVLVAVLRLWCSAYPHHLGRVREPLLWVPNW